MATINFYVDKHVGALIDERAQADGTTAGAAARDLVMRGIVQEPLFAAILGAFEATRDTEPQLTVDQVRARLDRVDVGLEERIFAPGGLEELLVALSHATLDGVTILRRQRHPVLPDKYSRLWWPAD